MGKQRRAKMVNKVLVAQFLSFSAEIVRVHLFDLNFSDYYVLVIWSIEMPSFHYLKNVYIIFI